jgi:hypothetical protein
VLQDLGRQRVILGQLFQHLFVGAGGAGGVFLTTGRPSLVKKISPICFGAAQVERLAGQLVRLASSA